MCCAAGTGNWRRQMLYSVTYTYLSGFSRNATAQRNDHTRVRYWGSCLSPPSAAGRTPSRPLPPWTRQTWSLHCTAHTVWLHEATPTPPVSINQGSGWLIVISASVIFAASLLYMHVHVLGFLLLCLHIFISGCSCLEAYKCMQ